MNDETLQPHNVCIYDRKKAEMTGISEVESFHDAGITLLSGFGTISVEGEELKIDSFSVETGKICISGNITGLYYYENAKPARSGFFSRREK